MQLHEYRLGWYVEPHTSQEYEHLKYLLETLANQHRCAGAGQAATPAHEQDTREQPLLEVGKAHQGQVPGEQNETISCSKVHGRKAGVNAAFPLRQGNSVKSCKQYTV